MFYWGQLLKEEKLRNHDKAEEESQDVMSARDKLQHGSVKSCGARSVPQHSSSLRPFDTSLSCQSVPGYKLREHI